MAVLAHGSECDRHRRDHPKRWGLIGRFQNCPVVAEGCDKVLTASGEVCLGQPLSLFRLSGLHRRVGGLALLPLGLEG